MTPEKRLKEIEKRYEFGSRLNVMSQDIQWLIARVKSLEEDLETIANKKTCSDLFGVEKYNSYEEAWEGVAEFARKAIESEGRNGGTT